MTGIPHSLPPAAEAYRGVIAADRWKIGQLSPGDKLRFVPVNITDAVVADSLQRRLIATGAGHGAGPARPMETLSPILMVIPESPGRPRTVYRQQGDRNILVEYGPIVLDIELRIRVHALMTELERLALPGIVDVVHRKQRLDRRVEAPSDVAEGVAGLDRVGHRRSRRGGRRRRGLDGRRGGGRRRRLRRRGDDWRRARRDDRRLRREAGSWRGRCADTRRGGQGACHGHPRQPEHGRTRHTRDHDR